MDGYIKRGRERDEISNYACISEIEECVHFTLGGNVKDTLRI